MIIGNAPRGKTSRISSDDVWPLRRDDGRTWDEAKKLKKASEHRSKDDE